MEKTFKIEFTEQQLNVLNGALQETPYKYSAPLIAHINAEIQKIFDAKVDESE